MPASPVHAPAASSSGSRKALAEAAHAFFFVLGLAWQLADGSCLEEPWQYFGRPSLGAALAAARRDGVAGAFGRSFLGVSRIEDFETNSHAPWATRAIEQHLASTLIEALAPRIEGALVDVDLAAFAEPARSASVPAAIEDTPWWTYEGALGSGTLAGVTPVAASTPA